MGGWDVECGHGGRGWIRWADCFLCLHWVGGQWVISCENGRVVCFLFE